MSFVMVPTWLIEADILPSSLRVWLALGAYGTFSPETGTYESIHPSVETVCQRAKVSEATFRRAMTELIGLGAARRIERFDPRTGLQICNAYQLMTGTLTPPSPVTHEPPRAVTDDGAGGSPVSPNPEPLYQEPSTKNIQEPSVPAQPAHEPQKANEILKTLIDACAAGGVLLTPRIKGMYAKKFKELLDGGIPAPLVLEALRVSWRKKTIDRVQLLDNYLIEVQAGERVQDARTKTEVRSDQVTDLLDQARAVVVAQGGNPDNNRLMSKTMRDIRTGVIDVAQALGASFTQMQIGMA